MPLLVLIRHGQSQWNLENRFTGWVDVPLSLQGQQEALKAGEKIANLNFDLAYTSTLSRAQQTLFLACSQGKRGKTPIMQHNSGRPQDWSHHTGDETTELPVIQSEAINERYYGDLQGLNKAETAEKFGKEQVHIWRRSYDTPPPNGESLKDTLERVLPYFQQEIEPKLQQGKNILVAAHGNSLRAMIKYLENISDEEIPSLEIPTGVPIKYVIERGKVVSKEVME